MGSAFTRRSALTLAGLAGLATAGCSSNNSTSSPVPSSAPASTSASPSPSVDSRPRWPLTGRLLEDTSAAKHAAVAVKVPDNKYEHPQEGINDADIVFVELEGYLDSNGYSSTRLMPVYHSKFAKNAAPVRSMRPTDVPLLAPMTAVIGSTGGAPWVQNYLEKYNKYIVSDLQNIDMQGTGAYSINSERIYTYNGSRYYDRAVVCHPKVLGGLAKKFQDGPQVSYFPFATETDTPSAESGKAAKYIGVPWKGDDYVMGYDYDAKSKKYLRSMPWGKHTELDGSRVTTENVLVIKASQYTDKLAEGAGNPELIQQVVDSSGDFLYATGGKYVTGKWKKDDVQDLFKFTLDDGSPLFMTPGRTFVEIPNKTAKIIVKG